MGAPKPKLPCIYCGTPTRRGDKGEHVVPEAIDGALTLNDFPDRYVCGNCNSGVLSIIDKELCSRSYLSIIASQEINAHLWQAWDVDHAAHNLLVEARPAWHTDETLSCLVCYPQITFETTGPDVRADADEALRFGREDLAKVLFRAIRQCFERYCAGVRGSLHFEKVRSGVIQGGYRLAPRVFTRHSIFEIARNIDNQSFILRFVTEEDKRFALLWMSRLRENREFKGWSQKLGSYCPTLSFFFDGGDTLRALMKLGVNLIAAFCPNTPVNRQTFERVIRVVRGEIPITPELMANNGFVDAEDIQALGSDRKSHSFRLVYLDGMWNIYSSFFGGRIGAFVRFPGPNKESWNSANIVAPLKSKNWPFTPSSLLQLMTVRIEWNESKKITPSLKLQNSVSSFQVELVRKRK